MRGRNSYSVEQKLGRKFRAERTRIGLSQDEMATALGLTQGYVSAIERGLANPSLHIIVRFAEIAGCEVSELFKF